MGLFGLGSFGEGLVKGLAESATVSLQDEIGRIEDSIKSASDIRIKRIVQDQDRRRDEAEKIVKALKRARANLGGVDSPEAAVRAASLLKKEGDLKSFNTLIDKISQRTDMDFDKYFGDVSKMSPAASDLDIAYSFIDETTIPLPSSEAGLEAVKPKGIMKYLGPDIDAEKLVEERTAEQMQMMDLGVRDIRKVAVPTIEFKEEAFKLDGMSSEDEFNYIQDKITKGNLTTDQKSFYSERANQLAGNMGLDKQMELAVQRLNNAQTANEKAAAQQEVMQLGRQKRKIDAFRTGNPIEVLKLDRLEAIENNDYARASEIGDELVKAGAMTINAQTSQLTALAQSGDTNARNRLLDIAKFNASLNQEVKNATAIVTIPAMEAIKTAARISVRNRLKDDAELQAAGLQFKIDDAGNYIPDWSSIKNKSDVLSLYNKKFDAGLNSWYEKRQKISDINQDVNFKAAYLEHTSGLNITEDTGEVIDTSKKPEFSQEQIDTIRSFGDDSKAGEAFINSLQKQASEEGRIVDIDAIISAANSAGKSEDFINGVLLKTREGSLSVSDLSEPKVIATPQQEDALDVIRKMPLLQRASEDLKIKEVSSKLNISEDEAKKIVQDLGDVEFTLEQQRTQAKKIIDSTFGSDYREIKQIASQLNISIDDARKLHAEVSAEKKSTGGLMSKK